jgi:hypothetical protein
MTNEHDLQQVLQDLLDGKVLCFDHDDQYDDEIDEDVEEFDDDASDVTVISVRTYKEVGMLSDNKGLVINLSDGTQFQLQIVRSR